MQAVLGPRGRWVLTWSGVVVPAVVHSTVGHEGEGGDSKQAAIRVRRRRIWWRGQERKGWWYRDERGPWR